jgi:predicted porin
MQVVDINVVVVEPAQTLGDGEPTDAGGFHRTDQRLISCMWDKSGLVGNNHKHGTQTAVRALAQRCKPKVVLTPDSYLTLDKFSMKKTHIALAAFGAMAGAAHAQSTVTLYGLVDAYIGQTTREVTGAAKIKQTVVNTSGQNNSRWGLRGTEDLGGGMKAIFVLESGFNTDTGSIAQTAAQGNTLFGRTALVGVSSDFGTVSLGRQYTVYDTLRGATDMIYSSNFATAGIVWATGIQDYQVRASNSIAYTSPDFSGITAGFVYGMGENKTPTTGPENNTSLLIKYANGPLLIGYAHQREKQIANGTNNYFAAGTPTNSPGIASIVSSTRKYNLLGASYDFGVAKLTGGYNTVKNETLKDKEFQVGVSVPFGVAAAVAAGYSRSKSEGAGANNKGIGLSVLGTYALSKRTNLYAGGLQTKIETANAATTTKVSTFAIGVRHVF